MSNFSLEMKRKTQQSLLSAWDKLKRNRDDTNDGKLFSFKNAIKISSLIFSESMCNFISSVNTTTCNPVLGPHMESK